MLNIVDDYEGDGGEYYGEGFLDNFVPLKWTPAVADLLSTAGKEIIAQATVIRTPLNSMLTKLLNMVSGGQYKRVIREKGYDAFYHLALVVKTQSGNTYTIEKNEGLNFARGDPRTPSSEVLPVPSFPVISIAELYDKVRVQQGEKFFRYSASSNSCQHFIQDVMLSNGISDPSIIGFVRQSTESLFEKNPMFRKLANTVTDVAAIAMAASQAPRNLQRRIESGIRRSGIQKQVNQVVQRQVPNVVQNVAKKAGRRIKKFFGRGLLVKGMKVAELKAIVKLHKKEFGRKILVTGMKKAQLIALVQELDEMGVGSA